jgi:Chalcone isomerase-like
MSKSALIFLLLFVPLAQAEEPVEEQLQSFDVIGEAQFNYMFWRIYDIALYSPNSTFTADPPFAISIRYSRHFSGDSIADYSSQLMRRQGISDEFRLAGWHAQMDEIFPDVQEGSTLTGLYAANRQTIFYHDDEEIGRIRDPLFGQYFFGIWLSEKTNAPKLRAQLIGATSGR